MSELENMTLAELREIAKEQNIKNIYKLKKDELIKVLIDLQRSINNQAKEEEKKERHVIRVPLKRTQPKYDSNDEDETLEVEESVIDYKVTNDEDEIVEGILEV